MKARWLELVEKSISAMVAAIEIYNKPGFHYCEETFSVLCINSWELLIKALWLNKNGNRLKSLYVYERAIKKDGTKSKRMRVKLTRSGSPFTHSLEYLGSRLLSKGLLDATAWQNIVAVTEIRDTAIHFHNRDPQFSQRLQEVASASVKNYAIALTDWFDRDLADFNFFLMPLSFVGPSSCTDSVLLSKEEKDLVKYIDMVDATSNQTGRYSVAVNINITFRKSKAKNALMTRLSSEPGATPITLSEEQIRKKYRLTYSELLDTCKRRCLDFKINRIFYDTKKSLELDQRYAIKRLPDPENPKSSKKIFYSEAIFSSLDRIYRRKS